MNQDLTSFEYNAPDAEQLERLKRTRSAIRDAYNVIMKELPPCRERSLAITKLEEASMWANKGVVFNPVPA